MPVGSARNELLTNSYLPTALTSDLPGLYAYGQVRITVDDNRRILVTWTKLPLPSLTGSLSSTEVEGVQRGSFNLQNKDVCSSICCYMYIFFRRA